jgi:protein-S-isoprenylcysteine O-methyltransferase Ste14
MKPIYRKIMYICLWLLFYPQIWYYFLIPELFFEGTYMPQLTAIIICYIIGIVDTYYRPFSDSIKEDIATNPIYNIILLGLFLLNPLLVVAAFKENRNIISAYIPPWDSPIVSVIGITLLVLSGIISVTGRIQLSWFGSGVLHIEKDHRLITTGIYGVIRHPIYSGSVFGVIGLFMAFRSVIVLCFVTLLYFMVIRHRLLFEEKMLTEEFGDQYRDYMKKTKRLIPYIY